MFMQLESGLREDLLLCDHGELEPGRGLGCRETEGELHAQSSLRVWGIIWTAHSLGPKLAWNTAKGSPDLTGLLCPVAVESEPRRTYLCNSCFSFLSLCSVMAGKFLLKEPRS